MRAALPLSILALALASCSEAPEYARLDLAARFEPGDLLDGPRPFGDGLGLAPSDVAGDPFGQWIGGELPPAAWVELADGLWLAPRPVGNLALLQSAAVPDRLTAPGREFEAVRVDESPGSVAEIPPDRFAAVLDQVYLKLAPGERPPEGLRLETFVSRGRAEGDAWRVELGRWSALGIPVWTGQREYLELPDVGGATLTLGTAAIAPRAAALGDGEAEPAGTVTFALEIDGEPLVEWTQAVTAAGTLERRRFGLPPWLDSGTLGLRVDGDPAIAAFLNPTLVRHPDRAPERPNVLLFLADTFRADNLAAYGGEHALTPELDALIEEGLLFERAWTTAIWTLPSQASMLTGLLPFRHTAIRPGRRIPEPAVTLAEHLRAAGYRTAAVTDAGLVSRRHRFDQGFEFFDELFRDEFDATHEAVLDVLAADDGRPLFLFVQSYRVHRPYRVSARTRAEHGERLGIEGEFDPTFAELEAAGWRSGAAPLPDALRDTVRRLEAQYRGGVIDFDRAFADFHADLARRGFFEPGRMLFTSDHGEAFGEHGALWHHVGVWETMARVPMFVHGSGIEPGREHAAASLVDVPRTVCALAGVEPHAEWSGASLLALEGDRPAWTFQCPPDLPGRMGLVDGDLKAHLEASAAAVEGARLDGVYDLARDPGEQRADLVPAERGRELVETWSARALEALEPALEDDPAPLGRADEERLRALGYLEGGD